MFIDTWTIPRACSSNPSAFTFGRPPLLALIFLAIAFATWTSLDARVMLSAINGIRGAPPPRPPPSRLVEVHGYLQILCYSRGNLVRDLDAVIYRDTGEWDER